MGKIINVQNDVMFILMKNYETRNDDELLYAEVIGIRNPKLATQPLNVAMKNIKKYGLPSFCSVSRSRRKLQEKYPELRGDEVGRRARRDKEDEYRAYART